MTLEEEWYNKSKLNILKFVPQTINANRDYPYHDFKAFDDGDEPCNYDVGNSNMNRQGTQYKNFISKSTLIYSDAVCTIRFNSANNVLITIPADFPIEFYCNIRKVFVVSIGSEGTLYCWFDGTLPDEGRSAK